MARAFAAERIRPAAPAIDEADHKVPWDLSTGGRGVGLTDFMLPADHGGGGIEDCFTGCLVQAALCHGDIGIGNLITSNGFFAAAVTALGPPEQQARWLAPLTAPAAADRARRHGARGGLRRRRPADAGAPDGRRLRARRAEGVDLQRGGLRRLPDLRDGGPGEARPRGHGLRGRGRRARADGRVADEEARAAGDRSAEVFLSGVEVPAEHRLGGEGEGFYGLMRCFDSSRIMLAAAATGLARAALEYATAYARERRQFGGRSSSTRRSPSGWPTWPCAPTPRSC